MIGERLMLVLGLCLPTFVLDCSASLEDLHPAEVEQIKQAQISTEMTVAFRTFDGVHYLTAERDGGGTISANRSALLEWERFIISDLDGGSLLSGDQIRIRHVSAEGKDFWLCADLNGGGPGSVLRDNRTIPLEWETFTIWQQGGGPVKGGSIVNLQATTQPFYVSAERGG